MFCTCKEDPLRSNVTFRDDFENSTWNLSTVMVALPLSQVYSESVPMVSAALTTAARLAARPAADASERDVNHLMMQARLLYRRESNENKKWNEEVYLSGVERSEIGSSATETNGPHAFFLQRGSRLAVRVASGRRERRREATRRLLISDSPLPLRPGIAASSVAVVYYNRRTGQCKPLQSQHSPAVTAVTFARKLMGSQMIAPRVVVCRFVAAVRARLCQSKNT